MASVSLIDSKLEELLSSSLFPQGEIASAARYSVLASGKRLRPRLLLATIEAYGIPLEHGLVPACALELIHTYSLIHDDLPCMDNDDIRREKPSLHKVYTEGHTLLTGDFLLTYAFQLLSESPHLSSDQKIDLIRTLSLRAGAHGMIGGQESDLASFGKAIDLETLTTIHKKKTAALITAALECGSIIAHSPDLDLLTQIGENLGLAFQIVDDILDDDTEQPTILKILSKEASLAYAHKLLTLVIQKIDSLSHTAPQLKSLVSEMGLSKFA